MKYEDIYPPEDCIEYGQLAKSDGADAILMSAPFYAAPNQTELANHALAIDREVNLPIMLYNPTLIQSILAGTQLRYTVARFSDYPRCE